MTRQLNQSYTKEHTVLARVIEFGLHSNRLRHSLMNIINWRTKSDMMKSSEMQFIIIRLISFADCAQLQTLHDMLLLCCNLWPSAFIFPEGKSKRKTVTEIRTINHIWGGQCCSYHFLKSAGWMSFDRFRFALSPKWTLPLSHLR